MQGFNQSTPHHSQNAHRNLAQPVMMGPPIRLGFKNENEPSSVIHISPAAPLPAPGQNTWGQSGGRQGNQNWKKRAHNEAFGSARTSIPRGPAPPAVPSFGASLPGKPSPAPGTGKKNKKKKKRKHNQLGLTPRTEEHESSEEEDDEDEEAKLAEAVGTNGQAGQGHL